MRAAVALRDVVGEDQHVLVIAVVPPQRDLDRHAVALAPHQQRLVDQRGLGAVEIAHEGFEPAFVEQLLAPHLGMARVGQDDADAGIEEGQFAQPMLDRAVVELDHGEGLGRGQEGDFGAALGRAVDLGRRADHLQAVHRVAVLELHRVFVAVAPDAQLQRGGQRVDDRHADAVQPARDLVGILVELPAGVQLGHDDLGGRNALLGVDAGRDAAAVVGDRAGAVGIQRHGHQGGVAAERLVDGVVDHLVDHVMQAGAVVRVADIHARALAHGIEAAQHLDGIGAIFVGHGFRGSRGNRFSHRMSNFLRPRGRLHHGDTQPLVRRTSFWRGCPVRIRADAEPPRSETLRSG